MAGETYDLIIRRGRVLDGTGGPWFQADIAIKDGRIAQVGYLDGATAANTLDAEGLWVTPGFFDAHTHSDFALIANPFPKSQLLQGVTSEVDGQCGYSAFPLVASSRGFTFEPKGGIKIDWSTPGEYFDRLAQAQPGINTAVFAGHTIIRAAVAGRDDRPVTPDELDKMKTHVREAMEAGALGLSTGLDYPPGGSADVKELVELCKVVRQYGGMYVSHLRGYTGTFVEAVAEAIAIGRGAGVPVQISHFGAAGKNNMELSRKALELIDEAREEGVDVMIDVIPYGTGGAWWGPRAIFPAWAYDWRKDNLDHVRELLLDPANRARLREEVEARRTMEKKGFEQERLIFSEWERIFLAETRPGSPHQTLVDKNMIEIGRALNKAPVDAYFDLLVEEYPVFSSVHIVRDLIETTELLRRPYTMFGSDSVATSPEAADQPFNAMQAHPRNYGWVPTILGTFVRDKGLLTWEEAICKLTSLPAQRFGFAGRGLLRAGMWADIVILDPAEINPGSTWRQPRLLPQGIHHVLVNGQFAVHNCQPTGVRAGQVVRTRRKDSGPA